MFIDRPEVENYVYAKLLSDATVLFITVLNIVLIFKIILWVREKAPFGAQTVDKVSLYKGEAFLVH